MFRASAKVVLFNSVTSDVPGDFLLMMLLYLCQMPSSVVSWITVITLSSININCNVWKIVQLKLYQNSSGITLGLKKLHWFPVERCLLFKVHS